MLLQGVSGITDLITTPGLINTDFADVSAVMRDAGSALMGIGKARGQSRALEAARMAVSSPPLEVADRRCARCAPDDRRGSDLGLYEVNEAAEIIAQAADADANIIFGAVIDDALGDEVKVTVIAAGSTTTPPHSAGRRARGSCVPWSGARRRRPGRPRRCRVAAAAGRRR